MEAAGFRVDLQQREKFTSRVRNVIRDYPFGLGVIKEFLANADDAGAASFAVVLDGREHGQVSLPLDARTPLAANVSKHILHIIQ